MQETTSTIPKGDLELRTWCMPSDTNPSGDIFGGWLLGQMDIAGAITARKIAKGRTATIAVNSMEFHQPVFVGDILCCYTHVEKIGTSSITINIEAWVNRKNSTENLKVTEGVFTFVAIDDDRRPRPIKTNPNQE